MLLGAAGSATRKVLTCVLNMIYWKSKAIFGCRTDKKSEEKQKLCRK
ncbi:hypothetical protein HMPREF9436_02786 [Faecalibacterium cf. prausnitzii KLE1255]|uniref:Uncharacterized protein n=1 Tax=Faecalibacterium cf. prausnitzii KLE1255 TaxID=748224 RepID=E2ZM73_9FIRM|nr:hypothetical protein HMPREF9436_02786 [Faecalibacterium cf. prausnitzii KLE1255]